MSKRNQLTGTCVALLTAASVCCSGTKTTASPTAGATGPRLLCALRNNATIVAASTNAAPKLVVEELDCAGSSGQGHTPYDLAGRSLTPVHEWFRAPELGLSDMLSDEELGRSFMAEPYVSVSSGGLLLDGWLAVQHGLRVLVPGCNGVALLLEPSLGWAAVPVSFDLDQSSVVFEQVRIGAWSPASPAATTAGVVADLQLSPNEIEFRHCSPLNPRTQKLHQTAFELAATL